MNNRERMLIIISDNKLERRDVAELLSVKKDEVDRWLLPNESKNQLPIPDMAIELLELKVAGHSSDSRPGSGLPEGE